MSATYESLLSPKRIRQSSSKKKDINAESASDRGRLVFSSPFRRLQKKAQVFPLETNASIRSRMTHSLEVAHIGRYISSLIIEQIHNQAKKLGLEGNEIAFMNFVETSCLMHDIGNPPFGHFGENAIQDWFNENGLDVFEKATKIKDHKLLEFKNKYLSDFCHFDGNAQGLRIVTKLQGDDGKTGLNLTFSQLASYLKYTHPSSDIDDELLFRQKAGYFQSELDVVTRMWKSLGMKSNVRHPLVYIMEAADDIAYCMSDVEDGIEKGIITEDVFWKELSIIWDSFDNLSKRDYLPSIIVKARKKQIIDPFTVFKTEITNRMAKFSADRFIKNHENILLGDSGPIFSEDSIEYWTLKSLKKFAKKHIFRSPEAENIELAGYEIMKGLLKHFSPLLICSMEDFESILNFEKSSKNLKKTDLHRRLVNRLPKKYIKTYIKTVEGKSLAEEWYHRAHLIVDFISCMTDDFALNTYQLLSGIKVN